MTKAERDHLNAVAALGCQVCHDQALGHSEAEIHHPRSGMGMSQRASHFDAIPLCPIHHRLGGYGIAFHAGPKLWQRAYGTERELLERVRQRLGITA